MNFWDGYWAFMTTHWFWGGIITMVVVFFISQTIKGLFKSVFGMVQIKKKVNVERQEDDRKPAKTAWERLRGGDDED